MTRCYAAPDKWPEGGGRLTLSKDESHHLVKVLRAVPGDDVSVFDGRGRAASAKIAAVSAGTVTLEILNGGIGCTPPPVPSVTLIQALSKPKAMDAVFQKSTELGAARILPFAAARSVVQGGDVWRKKNTVRWNKIVINAAKQCGLDHLPAIGHVTGLEDALRNCKPCDLLLFGSLDSDALPFGEIRNFANNKRIGDVAVVIGPEGDLTGNEKETIKKYGGLPVTLGPRVLRVETAALCAIVLINHVLS